MGLINIFEQLDPCYSWIKSVEFYTSTFIRNLVFHNLMLASYTTIIITMGFIFGAIFGSFVNATVYRLKHKVSLVNDRSFCPHCKEQIKWYDLVPIFSYLALGGKCRNCKKKIAFHYPLIEFLTGVYSTFLTYAFVIGTLSGIEFMIYFLIGVNMMIIILSDFLYLEIPDEAQIIHLILSTLLLVVLGKDFLFALISGLMALGFFLIIFKVAGEERMGFADVKLAFGIGYLFQIIAFLWLVVFSSFAGIFIGFIMSWLGKFDIKKLKVPFGGVLGAVSLIFIILMLLTEIQTFLKLNQLDLLF